MNSTPPRAITIPRRQHGAALVISLLLLLVLTILGVTAMNSSILQGFMATSYQQQAVTLADAENVLLAGEFDIEKMIANGIDGRAWYLNLYDPADPLDVFPAQNLDEQWTNSWVIEYLTRTDIDGESAAIGGGLEDSAVHIHRVSARVDPADERGGLRIVQSLYVTLYRPNE